MPILNFYVGTTKFDTGEPVEVDLLVTMGSSISEYLWRLLSLHCSWNMAQ